MSDCVQDLQNLGVTRCTKAPMMFKGMITTPLNFSFAPGDMVDDATFQAAIQAAIKAPVPNRIYFWPFFLTFEDASEESTYQKTPLQKKKVTEGNYSYNIGISEALCLHKAMYSHRASNQRVIFIDIENQAFGTLDGSGNFMGFLPSLIDIGKLKVSNGTDATITPVSIELQDPSEINVDGALADVSFINRLERLTDVTVTIVSTDGDDSFVVNVEVTCDGTPVIGLVIADFAVTTTAGAAQTMTTVTDNGDGTYTIAKSGGGIVDGFVDLVAADALTLDAYESTGPATLNVTA